jgi:hypothetical protein
MWASDLLSGRDSPALRVRLLPVLPEQVPVRVMPRSARNLMPGWVAAVTTPWSIYVREDVLDGEPDRLARLLVHELVHARQWRTYGPIGFLRRYLSDYLAGRLRRLNHREAYMRIGLEAEAYGIAARV